MQRSLLAATAILVGILAGGTAQAGAWAGHRGPGAAPTFYRPPVDGFTHGYAAHGPMVVRGRQQAFVRPLPPVTGVLHMQPESVYGHPGWQGPSYASRGPAIYDVRGGFGRGAFATREGYGFGPRRWSGTRLADGGGRGYGYGRTGRHYDRYGVRHHRVGYAVAAAGGYAAGSYAAGGYGAGSYGDAGYGTGGGYAETPLTVRYGEPPLRAPSGYAGGYGYGYGEAAAPSYQSVAVPAAYPYGPAGGLAVYSAGAYGPGPRIITIPSGYGASGGCTCGG